MKAALARRRTVQRRIAWLLVTLALSFTLSGCWGKRELEERSLIEIIGVDDGAKERLLVTVVIALPRAHAPQGGGPQGPPSLTLSAEGRDLLDAFIKIGAFSSRELSGSHTTILILGEGFARHDIAPMVDAFSRGIEVRPNTLVGVCKGTANKFLHSLRSPEELTAADYLMTLVTLGYETLGVCPLVTANDFVNRYQAIEASPWAPYLDLAAPESEATQTSEPAATPPKGGEQEEAPKPGVVLGTAVFALHDGQYRMVGWLGPEESKSALLMAGKAQNWYLTFGYPGDLATATMFVRHVNVRTSVKRNHDSVEAHFTIRLTCTLDEYAVNPNAPTTTDAMRVAAAKTLEEQIAISADSTLRRLGELESDVIALGRSAHGTFLTYPEFAAFGWPSKLRTVKPFFDVRVQVFSTGFTFQRAFPK